MRKFFAISIVVLNFSFLFAETTQKDSLLSQADIFYLKGEYAKALEVFQNSLVDDNGVANKQHALLNIGKIYIDIDDPQSAYPYLNQSLQLSTEEKDTLQIGLSYNSLGSYFTAIKHADSLFICYQEALKCFTTVAYKIGIAGVNNNIANSYFREGNYDLALTHYTNSYKIAKELSNPKDVSLYLLNIGSVYSYLEKREEALKSLTLAYSIADSANFKLNKMRAANELYFYYKKEKNNALALQYFEIVDEIEREIFGSSLQDEISTLKNRIAINEKNSKIALLTKGKKLGEAKLRNRNFLIIILVIAILLVVILIGYVVKRKNFKQQILNEKLEKGKIKGKLRQKELDLVKEKSDSKSRELAAVSILQEEKNELLKRIQTAIKLYQQTNDEAIAAQVFTEINDNLRVENDWEVFKLHFEEVHPAFFKSLKEQFPELTQNNLKLCAYIKIGLTNKEIARILAVEPESIKSAKKRLKKKLSISAGEKFNF